MKFAVALLITAFAALTVWGQSPPTLHIVTEIPNLPSDLYYGNTKVKPLRLRPGTNTPITINDADFFVNQQYVDFLSRFPDQSGFDFWSGEITSCNGDAACIDARRTNTSGAFFLSIEFQETGYLVERMYKVAFGDAQAQSTDGGAHPILVPIVRRGEFLPDQLQIGQGVIVGQTGWEQQLASNRQAFVDAFVQRPAFQSVYGGLNNSQYVDQLLTNTRIIWTQGERDALVDGLASGTLTRAGVLGQVAADQRFIATKRNQMFVMMEYFGYLHRDPDATGYQFWLNKLNQFGGNYQQAEMVKAFIVSGEYRRRFGL